MRYCARKEGDAVLKTFVMFFLKKFVSSNLGRYHRALFMRSSQDLVLRDGSTGSLQFLLNRYSLLREVSSKLPIFPEKSEVLIRVFGILVISYRF